jgi:two-component system response regulator CpxR
MTEFFARYGMRVESASDGTRGLARAFSGEHDLVILDVMMPGLDGFEVLRQLRRRSQIPVIMLTARTTQADRIQGLETGADDYLPKPFGPEELLARIRAVLRRAGRLQTPEPLTREVTGVRVSASTREAWSDGEPVELTSIEFDILDYLVRSAGRVVSRDELAALLHQRDASPYERSLDVHISHIRAKLGARRDAIRTVRGVGYMFCLEPEKSAPR